MTAKASLRDSGIAKPIGIVGDDDYGPLAMLHQVAWGRRDLGTIFHDHVVRRDSPEAPQQTVKLLRWPPNFDDGDSLLETFGVSSVLMRKGYVRLLLDIVRDVSVHPPETEPVGPGGNVNDPDVGQDVELDVDILDYISQMKRRTAPNAIVTGTPGIGKSIFLLFVIALRVLAGLSTIFQFRIGHLCIINHEGVFQIDYPNGPKSLRRYVPKGTWVLVDCGDLDTVPSELISASLRFNGLIIQAASPQKRRFTWMTKATAVTQYWMALWTPEEIIQARDTQIWDNVAERPSEQALLDFCQQFGCSARFVFRYVLSKTNYEKMVLQKIATLTKEKIRNMLSNLQELVFYDEEASHLMIVAAPDPSDRRQFTLYIASEYLAERLSERLEGSSTGRRRTCIDYS